MNDNDPVTEFTLFVRHGLAHGMTRRAFLRRGAQVGLSLPAILGVLTACMAEPPQAAAPRLPSAMIASPEAAQATKPTLKTTFMPEAVQSGPSVTVPQPSATPQPAMRFAVIGDFGLAGTPEAAVAGLVKSWQPDFVITVGDNNYPEGLASTIDANIGQYYHEFIDGYSGDYGPGATTNRFFPVLGNHDWQSGTIKPYLDYFAPPGNGRYYTFDSGPARFFMIDSMPGEPDGVEPDSVQGQWLKNELAASTARWKIIAFHHAAFSSGMHGSSAWMQWPFHEWGASIVLAGHDHTYERLVINGLPYIVNGLGGGARYAPGCCPVEGSQLFFNSDHGAMLVTMDATQMTLQFNTIGGMMVDTITLT